MGLFHVLVWSVEEDLGELRILYCLIVLRVLNVLCMGLLFILDQVHLWCVTYLGVFICLLGLVLEVIHIPIFIHILANWAVLSPSTSFWSWYCCAGYLGFNFYKGFWNSGSDSVIGGWNGLIFSDFKKVAIHSSSLRPRGTGMSWGIL